MKDYYKILEISKEASPEIIEKAYKVLAKKYHPDIYPADKRFFAENKFKEIVEAYNVLSNPDLKAEYDSKIISNTNTNSYYSDTKNTNSQYSYYNNNDNQNYKKNSENNKSISYFNKYSNIFKELISKEIKKSSEERSRDLTAFILTIIIISALLFVFWNIPFIRNFLFPFA